MNVPKIAGPAALRRVGSGRAQRGLGLSNSNYDGKIAGLYDLEETLGESLTRSSRCRWLQSIFLGAASGHSFLIWKRLGRGFKSIPYDLEQCLTLALFKVKCHSSGLCVVAVFETLSNSSVCCG